jgi:hypothetical protein
MATLDTTTVYVDCGTRGIYSMSGKFSFSDDFVAYESLDLSNYVGEIVDVDVSPYNASTYSVTVDSNNSDLANSNVAVRLIHFDNGVAAADNTNASTVVFRMHVLAKRINS